MLVVIIVLVVVVMPTSLLFLGADMIDKIAQKAKDALLSHSATDEFEAAVQLENLKNMSTFKYVFLLPLYFSRIAGQSRSIY